MRVLDFRSQAEKKITQKWSQASGDGARLNPLTGFWNNLADTWTRHRVGRRRFGNSSAMIISVGNLALGGTGKTPVIMALAQGLSDLEPSSTAVGCILTRGYQSPLKGPLVVQPDNNQAGDEARLMARQLAHLNWPVVQARDRLAGLSFATEKWPGLKYILLEDGHQTAKIARHLDIVILDRWKLSEERGSQIVEPRTGAVFPFGPYRESQHGAQRAEVFILENAEPIAGMGPQGQAVLTFRRNLVLGRAVGEGPDLDSQAPYACLSGIARPEKFEEGLTELLGSSPQLAIRMKDHQDYQRAMVQEICQHLAAEDHLPLVTTAKDWIKLQGLLPRDLPVYVVDLELEWGQENALPQLVGERAKNIGT